MKRLLEKDVDINIKDIFGFTSLIWGKYEFGKFNIAIFKLSLFSKASRNGHDSIVKQLLEKNACINKKDCCGDTALIFCKFNLFN